MLMDPYSCLALTTNVAFLGLINHFLRVRGCQNFRVKLSFSLPSCCLYVYLNNVSIFLVMVHYDK